MLPNRSAQWHSGAIVVDYVACFSFALSVDITLVHFLGDVIRNTSDLLVRLTTQFSLGRPGPPSLGLLLREGRLGGSCLLGRQLCCQCLALGMAFSGHDVALGERRLPTACFYIRCSGNCSLFAIDSVELGTAHAVPTRPMVGVPCSAGPPAPVVPYIPFFRL